MRFNRATIQSPICGSSRMSTYTGRYAQSHGASWNGIPLKVGEMTMGDHLRRAGMDCWLVGKTHMRADEDGMARLGLDRDSVVGARVAECGFDIFERDDGMRPEGPDGMYDPDGALTYNAYLRAQGYEGSNPWHDYANSGIDDDGNVLSGWFLMNAAEPANIAEEDSETPYMTRRAMAFMERETGPWCCHVSYIKPHWPYIVPAPYHDMYGPEHMLPVVRSEDEYRTAHPILRAMMDNPIGRAFAREEVRRAVIPAYMGLIKQCDDQIGALVRWLEETGRMETTTLVLTSDHGDFLGDHWMGEKQFFHDTSIRVPLIIVDPSAEADATRGMVSDALVESIDLAPTFLEMAGGEPAPHVLEGQSLVPILHGTADDTDREVVFCEYDYAATPLAARMGVTPDEAVLYMCADRRWKLIHAEGGFRPILFDRENDPHELVDLGESPDHRDVIAQMYAHLNRWGRRISQRTTRSHEGLVAMRGKSQTRGIILGAVSADETHPHVAKHYVGKKATDKRQT